MLIAACKLTESKGINKTETQQKPRDQFNKRYGLSFEVLRLRFFYTPFVSFRLTCHCREIILAVRARFSVRCRCREVKIRVNVWIVRRNQNSGRRRELVNKDVQQ